MKFFYADGFCTGSDRIYFEYQRFQEKTEYRSVCYFNHPSDGLYSSLSVPAFQRRTQLDENSGFDRGYLFFHHLHPSLFHFEIIQ